MNNKVALVTGASGGLGSAIALRLGAEGFSVVVGYAGDKSTAQNVASEIEKGGGKAIALAADISNPSEVASLFEIIQNQLGGIDVLVNNAGRAIRKSLAEFSDTEFDSVIKTNLYGTFYCMREAARKMRNNGRIINISMSYQGAPIPGYGVYSASKAGIEQLTAVACKELGAKGITVNALRPGPANTPLFMNGKTPEMVKHFESMAALGRLTQPNDVADVISFLVSEKAAWVTGQSFAANGGYW